ncbi:conjugative transposon protein TraM [Pedobacter frigoris]|uniref:conjugative transposon protein TraM n=1 Tax=Pedobacter frigoris TaxID=2571272 RepID=UPI002931EBDF|nr:conjugative transposon protein TraM [Pedobacter frigoris]
MNNEQSQMKNRKLKFLLVVPALIIPFITLLFWALGGGAVEKAEAGSNMSIGLNTTLPDARLKEDPADKLSYYDQAETDSAKIKGEMDNDPYQQTVGGNDSTSLSSLGYKSEDILPTEGAQFNATAFNERKVYERLDQLNRTINQEQKTSTASNVPTGRGPAHSPENSEVARLEQMMQMMNRPAEPDQEMNQLNGMLDKILDIQNPQRVRDQLKQQSALKKGQVFAVTTNQSDAPITLLETEQDSKRKKQDRSAAPINGFHSIGSGSMSSGDSQNTIMAIVFGKQTVVSGALIKLQLVNSIFINGVMIPNGEFIYGTATLSGERLEVHIGKVTYRKSVYPVELTVCDVNGIEGIYIPGAISRDVAKTSADQGLQSVGLSTLDPSIGMQAASVGIQAAKSFLSKKVKLISVTVNSGHIVLLRDDNQK